MPVHQHTCLKCIEQQRLSQHTTEANKDDSNVAGSKYPGIDYVAETFHSTAGYPSLEPSKLEQDGSSEITVFLMPYANFISSENGFIHLLARSLYPCTHRGPYAKLRPGGSVQNPMC